MHSTCWHPTPLIAQCDGRHTSSLLQFTSRYNRHGCVFTLQLGFACFGVRHQSAVRWMRHLRLAGEDGGIELARCLLPLRDVHEVRHRTRSHVLEGQQSNRPLWMTAACA